MPVPDFQNMMLPLLRFAGDGQEHKWIEHNIGVARAYAYEIKRVDSDYFEES